MIMMVIDDYRVLNNKNITILNEAPRVINSLLYRFINYAPKWMPQLGASL